MTRISEQKGLGVREGLLGVRVALQAGKVRLESDTGDTQCKGAGPGQGGWGLGVRGGAGQGGHSWSVAGAWQV